MGGKGGLLNSTPPLPFREPTKDSRSVHVNECRSLKKLNKNLIIFFCTYISVPFYFSLPVSVKGTECYLQCDASAFPQWWQWCEASDCTKRMSLRSGYFSFFSVALCVGSRLVWLAQWPASPYNSRVAIGSDGKQLVSIGTKRPLDKDLFRLAGKFPRALFWRCKLSFKTARQRQKSYLLKNSRNRLKSNEITLTY